MIAQTIVKKPLFPTLIHDDTTRIIILLVILVVCLYTLFQLIRKNVF
jgi:hypothetical protein